MRGSIIVPVLIILVLLAYVAAEVGRDLASDHGGATFLRGALAAGWVLDDAEELAMRTLAADSSDVDHPHETWNAFGDELTKFNSSEGGQMGGVIVDMTGLFPINRLNSRHEAKSSNRRQYEVVFLRLLKGVQDAYGVEGDPKKYVDSLRFWMGDPVAPRNDDAYYHSQEPPYERPKRDVAYPQELALVYWEGVEEEDVRKIVLGDDGNLGLADFVTTWGSGKINMNTAPEAIVRAVCPDENKATAYWDAVREYRRGEQNDFGAPWYLPLADSIQMPRGVLPTYCLTVKSDAFALRLECRLGGLVRKQLTIVERDGKGQPVQVFRQSY